MINLKITVFFSLFFSFLILSQEKAVAEPSNFACFASPFGEILEKNKGVSLSHYFFDATHRG